MGTEFQFGRMESSGGDEGDGCPTKTLNATELD